MTSLANKISGLARRDAQRDLRELFPERWQMYKREAWEELEGKCVSADQHHSKSRNQANSRLAREYPGHYQLLLDTWREHYQDEFGYVDQRPDANRARRG